MGMRILKRYNHNANHRLTYKYHKTVAPSITLDKYCTDGKHDPRMQLTGGVTLQSLQEDKLRKRQKNTDRRKEYRNHSNPERDPREVGRQTREVKRALDKMYGK